MRLCAVERHPPISSLCRNRRTTSSRVPTPRKKNASARLPHSWSRPGETIFLASGTTTRAVLPGLSEVDFLNLVTNDLQIAMDAAEMENIALTMTGGSVRPGYYALRGVLAEDSMRVMKTGTAFVSCDAIDIQTGCYIANADEVGLLRQVVESTSYLVLLADHSKFFSGSFLSFCPIERVDLIISDTGLPADLCDEIRKKNIKLILA